jgi:5'-3' exonuclease
MDIEVKDNIILIDLSYFIFYRYYALIQWWKLAKPDDVLDNPSENEEFIKKFIKTFVDKFNEIPKKLKLKNFLIIGGKDCPREQIWRNSLFNNYKEQRVYDDSFMGGYFFKLAYEEIIPKLCPIINCDKLEADDCIALLAKHIKNKYDNKKIFIIANDMDYLQLADDTIKIINLKYKNLQESKNSTGNKECDLFCKIVLGDKSDNIPGIFKKCGPKTAINYYENRELFLEQLNKENALERFTLNNKIINFNEIPEELQKQFLEKLSI